MTNMEERIVKYLRAHKRGATGRELAKKVSVRKSQKEEYRKAFSRLLQDGIVTEYKGRYLLPQHLDLVQAEIVKVTGTFGFARITQTGKEVFIPGRDLMGTLSGDVVLLKQAQGSGQLPEGKVIRVLEQADPAISGILQRQEGRWMLLPDKYLRFPLAVRSWDPALSLREGDKALARIVHRGQRHSEHAVEVTASYGSSSSAAACSQAILAAAGVRQEFPPEVLEQAQAIAAGDGIHPKELAQRLDLRDQPIFTIDGEGSKDLDDAISLTRTDGGWELGVHIADVSYYVTHLSPLDQEALERGTSVYYADSVVPMLPKELSNGICSLNPGEDRLTFSALLTLDGEGRLCGYRFAKTVIRSRVKGIYSEVNAILEDRAPEELLKKYEGLVPILRDMRDLAGRMTINRLARGSVNLESVESKITVGSDGSAQDVQPRVTGVSEGVIEEFMLCANEAAATFALRKELPFVFRVHEAPAPDKLEELAGVLERLGVPYRRTKGTVASSQLSALLESVQGREIAPILNTMVLRSMAKAKYSEKNVGHFGLALENYTHFTSPIRRYPDLTIHRILSGLVTGMKMENIHKRFDAFVTSSAARSTAREIAAMTAERDCTACYKAEYMRRHIGETLDGVISSVTGFGLYVQLPNTVEGLLHQRDFPAGDWTWDGSISYSEQASGRRYRLGDSIQVLVAGVDVSAGQVDFALPGHAVDRSAE